MAQALTAFAIFMIVTVGIIMFLNKRTHDKMRDAAVAPQPETVSGLSKRQQRLVATMEPPKPPPTIEELVAEEAAATGVNDIPGGEDLDVSLKLRVYWRDEVVRRGCDDGRLEFRIEGDVLPERAETDDVRLVCVRSGVAAEPPPGAAAGRLSDEAHSPSDAEPTPGNPVDSGDVE